MKLKLTLLSFGACAGACLLSLHAQTTGATAGTGTTSGSTTTTTTPAGTSATGGAAGGATYGATGTAGTSNTTTPGAVTPAGTALPPTGTDTTTAVGAGTQSDFGAVTPPGSVTTGAPATALPGTSGSSVNRVSPGTDPLGPTTITRPSGVTSGPTNVIGGTVEIPRAPQNNPFVTPSTAATGALSNAQVPRDTLGLPAAIAAPNPPPAAAAETVPLSPGANYSWVPGHYMLSNGQWNWVAGAWVVPPSVGAAWVDGRYDPATRRWTPGHWEPGAHTNP